MYEMSQNPSEVIKNAEEFVNKTAKRSPRYSDADWKSALEQFIVMSKNYMENKGKMSQQEQDRFTAARLKFMSAIEAAGNEKIAMEVKEAYSSLAN